MEGPRETVASTGGNCYQALIRNRKSHDISQGSNHVKSPCHLLKLPTELRLEIWRYLVQQPCKKQLIFDIVRGRIHTDVFQDPEYPTSLSGLFLSFNRETYKEIKDVFYEITTFVIRVDGNGAVLCK